MSDQDHEAAMYEANQQLIEAESLLAAAMRDYYQVNGQVPANLLIIEEARVFMARAQRLGADPTKAAALEIHRLDQLAAGIRNEHRGNRTPPS